MVVSTPRSARIDYLGLTHVRQLEAIPHWSWESSAGKQRRDSAPNFDLGYRMLLDFVRENGHARVPQMVDGRVRSWGAGLRRGAMTSAPDDCPPSNGGSSKASRVGRGTRSTRSSLTRSSDSDGTSTPTTMRMSRSATDPVDGSALGVWVPAQRSKYATNSLQTSRVGELEKAAGWSW